MKKYIIIVLLITAFLAVGCTSQNDYEVFQEAVKKTEAVEKERSKLNFQLNMEFDEKELSQDIIKKINNYKNIRVNIDAQVNKNSSYNKIFIETEAVGLDAKLYSKDGLTYVVTSLLPKIVIIEDQGQNESELLSKELNNLNSKLSKIWNELYSSNNVAFTGEIILDTPEGNVKVKEYKIDLNDEQIKKAVQSSIEQIFENINEIKKEKIYNSIQKSLKQLSINNFTQKVYVNKDMYIAAEKLIFDMHFDNTQPESPENIIFELDMKRWDINQDQEIYFPEVNKENSINIKDMRKEQFMN